MKFIPGCVLLFTLLLALPGPAAAETAVKVKDEAVMETCDTAFAKTAKCPQRNCRLECIVGFDVENCPLVCKPIPCVEIEADYCPTHRCQIIEGCGGRKQCYYKTEHAPGKCGDLAYAGGDLECCEGLVKRCGIEFFDGTCDMNGINSVYSAPICVPCGNGICNQFENSCNCPEDCGEPNTSLDYDTIEFNFKSVGEPVLKENGKDSAPALEEIK